MNSPEIVGKIAEMTEHVEPIPQIAAKVIEMVGNSETTCEELSAIISKDPGLTSKVLSMSNASYYHRVEFITSLNMAVMILGFGTIQSLVLTISVGSLFRDAAKRATLFQVWKHSVATALIAERLGKRFRLPDQERYYIAGLLHDVGKLVFCRNFPEKFNAAFKRSVSEGIPCFKAEKAQFGFDHAQLGKAVLQKWHLPETYHDPVADHHRLERLESHGSITPVVHVADTIAHEILRSEDDPKWRPDPEVLGKLRLDSVDISEIITQDGPVILESLDMIAKF
jgi:putative nucleotidyltransferase with HDIG domain